MHGVFCALSRSVDRHIDPGGVTKPESVLGGSFCDPFQIGAARRHPHDPIARIPTERFFRPSAVKDDRPPGLMPTSARAS
jgi:hypothetical protein